MVAEEREPAWIDVNCGCWVPKIAGRDAGQEVREWLLILLVVLLLELLMLVLVVLHLPLLV